MQLDAHIPSGPVAEKWDRHKFDLKLVNYLADEFQKEQGVDLRKDKLALQRLRDAGRNRRSLGIDVAYGGGRHGDAIRRRRCRRRSLR